jgi:hypothetical protein
VTLVLPIFPAKEVITPYERMKMSTKSKMSCCMTFRDSDMKIDLRYAKL